MGKEFFANRACFLFKPPFTNWTEEEFNILTSMISDTIECEVGGAAKFYFFLPDLSLADGSFSLIIYRDEYVKKHPGEFGLKRKQVKDLEVTLPEDFNQMMFVLLCKISTGLSKLNTESSYELISIDEQGNEYVASYLGCTWQPEDEECDEEYDDEFGDDPSIFDFDEYEEYSIGNPDDDDDEDSDY